MALLLVIAIIYRLLNPFVQSKVDKLTFTGGKTGKTDSQRESGVITDKSKSGKQPLVSRFLNKPKVSAEVHKNLFSIYRPPVQTDINDEAQDIVNQDIQAGHNIDNLEKDSIQEIKEYISSYMLYGTYKSENTKAVFLSKDKLVLVAKKGDRLDGKYLIDDIQDNYIKITALELNETIHLDMREFNNE